MDAAVAAPRDDGDSRSSGLSRPPANGWEHGTEDRVEVLPGPLPCPLVQGRGGSRGGPCLVRGVDVT